MNFPKLLSFRGGDWTRGFTVYLISQYSFILCISSWWSFRIKNFLKDFCMQDKIFLVLLQKKSKWMSIMLSSTWINCFESRFSFYCLIILKYTFKLIDIFEVFCMDWRLIWSFWNGILALFSNLFYLYSFIYINKRNTIIKSINNKLLIKFYFDHN